MLTKEHSLWAEKYRPIGLDSYVGNDQLKSKIENYLKTNDIPHLMFAGKAGTGKTTLAKLIVKNIDCDYKYINASDKGGVDFIRNEIIPFASCISFKPLKVVILDEADYCTPQFQAALRNTMEKFSKNTRFILTCNYKERIIDPIQSRCQLFEVFPPSRKEVAVRMNEILNKENIAYDISDLALIINNDYPDIRRIINSAQKQSHEGLLEVDKQDIIENNYELKLLELLKSPNKSTFNDIRQLIADSKVRDYSSTFRFLFDNVDEFAGTNVSNIILIIAEAQYRDVISIDKEINFMSCIINILNSL